MTTEFEIVQLVQNLAWLGLALVSVRLYRRSRSSTAAWVAASFVSLAAVVWSGFVLERVYADDMPFWAIRLLLAVLMFFPYALYRFAGSFEVRTGPLDRIAAAATGAMVVFSLLLTDLPGPGEPYTSVAAVYVVGLVVVWVALLGVVTARLWRGGRGQPTLVRRRMRMLSGSALLLALSLIGSATQGTPEEPGAYEFLSGIVSVVIAGLFYVAFSPPPTLRAGWRQPEERELNAAAVQLMGATSPAQVTTILLPHVGRLLGARSVTFVDRDGVSLGGRTEGVVGVTSNVVAGDATIRVPLTSGELEVTTSRYTPFFGDEEVALAQRLGVLADLAIARTQLLVLERRTRAELERTNEELESFVYSASHDLKSPLIAMLGYLEVLQDESQLEEQARWYVERMHVNGLFMQDLIGDLLELSRVGRVDTESTDIDLAALVADLAVEIGHLAPQVHIEIDPRLPNLTVNATRIRQLFANLLENAVKHGGRDDLTIRVHVVELQADGVATIGVDDDGRGIPEAYREKVFGVFERLDATEAQGTGIGLAVCRKIARSLGGELSLAPSDGGARFRLAVPSSVVGPASSQPAPRPHVPGVGTASTQRVAT